MLFIYALGILAIPSTLAWGYKYMSKILEHRELMAEHTEELEDLREDVDELKQQVETLTSIVVDREMVPNSEDVESFMETLKASEVQQGVAVR